MRWPYHSPTKDFETVQNTVTCGNMLMTEHKICQVVPRSVNIRRVVLLYAMLKLLCTAFNYSCAQRLDNSSPFSVPRYMHFVTFVVSLITRLPHNAVDIIQKAVLRNTLGRIARAYERKSGMHYYGPKR
jgi:hypothetical protein